MRPPLVAAAIAIALIAVHPAAASAQQRKLRVVSVDSSPVVYAYVTLEGGTGLISDENGEVSLGAGKARRYNATVRRIGYQPWAGPLELPDTAALITITLHHIAQALDEVHVTATEPTASMSTPLRGFYNRWLLRQKGALSATFIGPEEIEFRHPARISDMLSGLNGVQFDHREGVAYGYNHQCVFAIAIDGQRQCPSGGCHVGGGGNIPQIVGRGGNGGIDKVVIDQILDVNDVIGIEVYTRGGNMPVSLQVSDPGCGVINFVTGSRKP